MRRFIFIIILACVAITSLVAQRRITPVERSARASTTVAQADSILKDSIKASVDTAKIIYPFWTGITVGANIWDPALRLLGQSYGGFDMSAEVSILNRFFPMVEVGFGNANSTPEEGNFTYKTPFALYGKIGGSYNFLFKKTSDYQFRLGFLLGYSSFKYDITNITINSGYWNENTKYEILNQKADALWGEIVAGIRVKAYKNFSLGWAFRYRIIFTYTKGSNSEPWYIPGVGSRTNPIGASFSIFYTIPFPSKKVAKEGNLNDLTPINDRKRVHTPDSIPHK